MPEPGFWKWIWRSWSLPLLLATRFARRVHSRQNRSQRELKKHWQTASFNYRYFVFSISTYSRFSLLYIFFLLVHKFSQFNMYFLSKFAKQGRSQNIYESILLFITEAFFNQFIRRIFSRFNKIFCKKTDYDKLSKNSKNSFSKIFL